MKIFILIISVLIIILTLFQKNNTSGITQLINSNLSLFDSKKDRGPEKYIQYIITGLVVIFLACVLLYNMGVFR